MKFNFSNTKISNLYVGERSKFENNVGTFERLFCKDQFKKIGFQNNIVQINRNFTIHTGTLRGLHFQYSPFAEEKVVTCLKGSVFDVALDIRRNSPTFLKWHGEILSESNSKCMFIPKGFAHGFVTLVNNCEILYFHSEFYSSKNEGGILYNDPIINIKWPIEIKHLSERDKKHEKLNSSFKGVEI
jgi:dTDP-4-dehydrorhamnose 3,5-epimerase